MTNLKLLEEKISLRNEMLKFLSSGDEIKFDNALSLNNEIALTSRRIESFEKMPYPKLQEDANDWTIEVPSIINIQ